MTSFKSAFIESFEDSTLRILIGAAFLSFLFGIFSDNEFQWVEGVSIIFGVIFLGLFTASSVMVKQKQKLRQYEEVVSEEVSVIRG
jgi:magnesium-transporting ATPase (P-type)